MKGFFLNYGNCIAINVCPLFFSDEEQQDVDTQVLFEFAQELEARYVRQTFFISSGTVHTK